MSYNKDFDLILKATKLKEILERVKNGEIKPTQHEIVLIKQLGETLNKFLKKQDELRSKKGA